MLHILELKYYKKFKKKLFENIRFYSYNSYILSDEIDDYKRSMRKIKFKEIKEIDNFAKEFIDNFDMRKLFFDKDKKKYDETDY